MYKLEVPHKYDYPALLAIWESSVKETHHFLNETDIEFYKHTIQSNNVFEAVNLTIVRDDGDKILGFMGVSGESLEMLFLDPKSRGKGIGKLLLTYAIDTLKICRVDVNEQNEAALNFYQHFGFKVISRSALDGTGKPYPILHMQLQLQ